MDLSEEVKKEPDIVRKLEKQMTPKRITVDSLFSLKHTATSSWLCSNCGTKQGSESSDLLCLSCLKFKPMVYYPHWKHNPGEITKKELKLISRRRRMERKLVIEAEKLGQSL